MDGEEQNTGSQPIVNRDEPIPIVAVSSPTDEEPTLSPGRRPSKREALKEKLHDVKRHHKAEDQTTIQDRLFST